MTAPHELDDLSQNLSETQDKKPCMKPFPSVPVPSLNLPLPLHIIHHPKEKKSKSTAIHAMVLAPNDTRIHEFPDFPPFDPNETLCLFPSPDSKLVSELDLSKFKQVVFIDSTWSQTKQICAHPRVQALTKVRIQNHRTHFWRVQDESPEFLATIEAIYYFYKEFHEATHGGKYDGEFDDLLYFFAYTYEHIQSVFTNDLTKLPSKKFKKEYLRSRQTDSSETPSSSPQETEQDEKQSDTPHKQ
ncbi:putative fibroblast growth factor 7 [Blattamonas nauphoetae]|uniref:tRNA-uridine aminocarboxypropyltransferase 1 n=1 Tax=Blattamonas nauphoetae TaxID=2049346 RepID=A0ABQ9YA85_9EUKA|nr:putative fibroblast growth factor 7 [Blattamonas nauphoetae]